MRRCALISVTDKTGVVAFAQGLCALDFSILSTGGTFDVLRRAGVEVQQVADYTGFPEIMGGRVKTLHPRIHGGILGQRDRADVLEVMQEHGIDPIDVVAVNLYRFNETVARPGVKRDEIVESIDIGGPSMIRSAAKNHADVVVVVDAGDYGSVLDELGRGQVGEATRRRLAAKAFAHTAAYDASIARWFASDVGERYGSHLAIAGDKVSNLRYGENPHQDAAFYAMPWSAPHGLAAARQLGGKELSYNNLLDLDAALGLVAEFEAPACVIVKHNNPCGTAQARDQTTAFHAALASDPVSAFGGIIALNRPFEVATARAMVEQGTFVEAIVAPSVADGVLEALAVAKWGSNVRVLALGGWPPPRPDLCFRQISGGFLVQGQDAPADPLEMKPVTLRAPTDAERATLAFAWKVCKHTKSNAIVLAQSTDGKTFATVGVGAGQMSRVDAVRIAVDKAGERARGAALASDAFFPFADGVEAATAAGVKAIAQPGGSRRDDEVIAAANATAATMVFTGRRHFRH